MATLPLKPQQNIQSPEVPTENISQPRPSLGIENKNKALLPIIVIVIFAIVILVGIVATVARVKNISRNKETVTVGDIASQVPSSTPIKVVNGNDAQEEKNNDARALVDAKTLLDGIKKYSEKNGYYPWQSSGVAPSSLNMVYITSEAPWVDDSNPACDVLKKLSQDSQSPCKSTKTLEPAFIQRITANPVRPLSVYFRGKEAGDSVYVCLPVSTSERRKAALDACKDSAGSGYTDIDPGTASNLCSGFEDTTDPVYSCITQ